MEPALYTKIDLNSWSRKDHFEFFTAMDEPFFGITIQLDMTQAYNYCKTKGYPLSLYYLYAASWASNQVEAFKYRILKGEPIVYNTIHLNAVQLRNDHSFVFTYIPFEDDFETFLKTAPKHQQEALKRTGLGITEDTMRIDSIHYSVLPWLDFTSLSHARSYKFPDSCPKISFGKLVKEDQKLRMACSIHVHHALMDGYHVGLFTEKLQTFLNKGQ